MKDHASFNVFILMHGTKKIKNKQSLGSYWSY